MKTPTRRAPRAKLSADERRAAIIQAVRRVFAEKGFHGTTTRALAEAAGVSEALIFKHFPNKESLYSAMKLSCCVAQNVERFERLQALEPSASTLIVIVHFMASKIAGPCGENDEDSAIQSRMMLRSLAEDGDFARLVLRGLAEHWIPKVSESLKAAVAAGDAAPEPVRANLSAWFVHHLPAIILTNLLPSKPAVDYGVPREKLLEQTVWFLLRGMGLKEEVIKRYYNPKALALLLG
jgi:AcrR family transcriptional regulator